MCARGFIALGHVCVADGCGGVAACKGRDTWLSAVMAALRPRWMQCVGAGLAQMAASGSLCPPLVAGHRVLPCLFFMGRGSRVVPSLLL